MRMAMRVQFAYIALKITNDPLQSVNSGTLLSKEKTFINWGMFLTFALPRLHNIFQNQIAI